MWLLKPNQNTKANIKLKIKIYKNKFLYISGQQNHDFHFWNYVNEYNLGGISFTNLIWTLISSLYLNLLFENQ